MKRTKGFTLLESMFTLLIFIALTLVGNLQLQSYREKVLLEQSVSQFKSALSQAGRIATMNSETVRINHKPIESFIEFKGTPYYNRLSLNPSVSLDHINNLTISKNGVISPKTVTFSNDSMKKDLKIQMAWGRVIDE